MFSMVLSPFVQANIREGLVGWWRLDEASGATAIDWSGKNNNGTYTGTIAMPAAQCKRSGCRSFNGSSDYIDCGIDASLAVTNFTLAFWMKAINPAGTLTYEQPVARQLSTSSKGNYGFSWSHQNASFEKAIFFSSGGIYTPVQINSVMSSNTWYHVAGTYDGSSLKVYVNGVLDNSVSVSGVPDTTSMRCVLGAGERTGDSNPAYFNGLLDDVRVYNRALSAQEVSDLYRSGIVLRSGVWRNAKFNQ